MTKSSDRSDAVKRIERLAKSARLTAKVAMTALNPLAGPVARQANLAPAKPLTEISQDIDLDRQKDWANHELRERERANAALPTARRRSPTRSRDVSPDKPPRGAQRTRER